MTWLTSHAAYEARWPDEAAMAERYEQHAQAMWLQRYGTLDGYQPGREFPCPGALRVTETAECGISTIRCDRCEFVTTARLRPSATAAIEARAGTPAF